MLQGVPNGVPEHVDELLFGQYVAHIVVVCGGGTILRIGIPGLRSKHTD